MPVAIVTGASRGLGRATARLLAGRGWSLVLDARGAAALRAVVLDLRTTSAIAVPGDVTDPHHRRALLEAADRLGELDVLVNNASELGPSPLPALATYPEAALRAVYETNVVAPLALIRLAIPTLSARGGVIVNVTSDAAVESYPRWGGYGSSKAALEHLTRTLAVEHPELRVYAFDPGDMRTEMHQRAFPGEDISDRAAPESVAPALARLLEDRPESGRYRAADLVAVAVEGEVEVGS